MTPHPLSQSRQMAATLRFIAERKNTVAPRAQSVGVDPLSSTDTKLRVLSLFAGVGGFDLGLERTGGFKTVAVSEIDPYASKVLAARFPSAVNLGDVSKAEFPDADVICAGFPCQDISIANQNATGLAGERSGLFWQVIRAIRMVGRPYVLLENVAELLNRGMGTVLGALASLGYDTQWHCIPASAVGASQERDRVWIIANPAEKRAARLLTSADISAARQGRQGGKAHLFDLANAPFERGDSYPQPLLCGLARGVSSRVDRVGACGNSVDPAIPELIGNAILAAIQSRSALPAAGAGDPANLPAAAARQGGGLCDVQRPFHGERYDNLA